MMQIEKKGENGGGFFLKSFLAGEWELVCFVLFCFVLFCFVLFCFVLFCFLERKS